MNSPLLAFSFGGPEAILVFVVILLLFGAKKLPELARGLGKSAGEFRRAREEFEEEIKKGEDIASGTKKEDKKKEEEIS